MASVARGRARAALVTLALGATAWAVRGGGAAAELNSGGAREREAPGAPTGAPEILTQRLAWLAGRWTGEQDGLEMEEHWTEPHGGALLGVHRDVKAGRMVSWEFLRIADDGDGLTYFASPRSSAPTAFRLAEISERRAVFENPRHDFPQRILYWLDAQGALHARIEGPRGGRVVGLEWVWTKAR